MNLHKKVDTSLPPAPLTPLIDMVFLLLSFFMIALHFENTKADERRKLPLDAIARPPAVKPEHELVLNLGYQRDAAGTRTRSVPEVFYNEQYVQVAAMSPELQQERRVLERLHGAQVTKDVTVLIRADAEVPTGLVQELVRQCQQAGFTKFVFRATVEEI